ncbi:MAG: hypothetical protein MUO62_02170 [Anaerolineales bacterium]|nr:hypothetical protein [Anaerolineales bacterium]
MKGHYFLILSIVVLIAIIVGCSPAPPPEPTATPVPTVHPGKAVVSSKCIACHDLGRVTNYKNDLHGWTLTVDQMILNGATLSDEQREQSIDYLAFTFPKE